MLSIDADAHVIETEKTWDYLEGTDRRYRPVPITVDMPSGKTQNFWIIGGRLIGGRDNIGQDTSKESREMANIDSRLRHMDDIGTGVQVLYPTLFLRPVTDNPRIELALCRSYNRWMAGIWSKAKDRLRWAVQLPLLTMDKALDELRWAHGNGACAVFMRGIEKVLNVHGGYVTPGLIDFHVHSYWGVNPYGFNADPICLASGVTTAVDAGSSGAVNFLGFKKLVHEQSRARMLAFVALAQHGVLNDPGELENLKFADPNGARKVSAMRAPSALGSRFGFIRRPSATTAGKRCE